MTTVWNRINTLLLLLVLFALLAIIAMLATGARGGPLDPLGAPASTNSVRLPGTPISQPADASGFPIVISQPGAYYLTSNINGAAGKNGIHIISDNVTLDLMGFTLDGPDGADGQVGIDSVFVPVQSVTVRNGIIRDWGGGIGLGPSFRSNLHDLQIVDNGYGIDIGTGGIISNLVVRDNGGVGMTIYEGAVLNSATEVRESVFTRNNGDGITINDANDVWIHDSSFAFNSSNGIELVAIANRNRILDNSFILNDAGDVNIGHPGQNNGDFQYNLVARNSFFPSILLFQIWDGGLNNSTPPLSSSESATNPWANVY